MYVTKCRGEHPIYGVMRRRLSLQSVAGPPEFSVFVPTRCRETNELKLCEPSAQPQRRIAPPRRLFISRKKREPSAAKARRCGRQEFAKFYQSLERHIVRTLSRLSSKGTKTFLRIVRCFASDFRSATVDVFLKYAARDGNDALDANSCRLTVHPTPPRIASWLRRSKKTHVGTDTTSDLICIGCNA